MRTQPGSGSWDYGWESMIWLTPREWRKSGQEERDDHR